MLRTQPSKIISGLSVPLLLAATLYVSTLITERQQLLADAASYNLTWSITQAVTEMNRFEQQVAESALPDRQIGTDAVLLRYEILCNRLRLLTDGAAAAFTREDPERRAVVAELAKAVGDVENWVGNLDQPGMRERILARLDPLNAPLVRLGAASNRESGERIAILGQDLMRLNHAFSLISAAVIICGCILLGLIIHKDRRLRGANAALAELVGNHHGRDADPVHTLGASAHAAAAEPGQLACAD